VVIDLTADDEPGAGPGASAGGGGAAARRHAALSAPSRGASASAVEVIDLTSDAALTEQLNDFIDLTQERFQRPRPGPPDLSGLDVLAEQRAGVRAFLRAKAAVLHVEQIEENPHSRPGAPLFTRFIQAWASAADTRVQLCFHGTAEANVDAICRDGLDPRRRAGQALVRAPPPASRPPHPRQGPGEYFATQADVSVAYCRGGRKMLVFAVLMDASGLTQQRGAERCGVIVCHKPEHQLPLFVVTFKPDARVAAAGAAALGALGAVTLPGGRGAPPAWAAAVAGIRAGGPLPAALHALLGGPAGVAAMGGMGKLAQIFGGPGAAPPPPPRWGAFGGPFLGGMPPPAPPPPAPARLQPPSRRRRREAYDDQDD